LCQSSCERTRDWDGSQGEGTERAGADESDDEVMRRVEAASDGGSESGEAACGKGCASVSLSRHVAADCSSSW